MVELGQIMKFVLCVLSTHLATVLVATSHVNTMVILCLLAASKLGMANQQTPAACTHNSLAVASALQPKLEKFSWCTHTGHSLRGTQAYLCRPHDVAGQTG